jgi:hypothetical protein
MAMTFTIDRERDLTIFKLAGDVAFGDFTTVIDRYRRAGPTKLELYDFVSFSGRAFTLQELYDLVDLTKQHAPPRPPGSKTALVVPDAISFGASRQYHSLADLNDLPWETGVFDTLANARQWLGVED